MKKLSSGFTIPAIVIIIIVVVVGFLVYGGEDLLGLTASDTTNFIILLPGIFVILIGFVVLYRTDGAVLVGAVAGIGLGFAYLIYQMDQLEILIPQTGMVATDIQIVVIVVFVLIGIMLAVRNS